MKKIKKKYNFVRPTSGSQISENLAQKSVLIYNKGGKKMSSQELFEEKEHQGLLSDWQAITSQKPAYKTREQREERRIQEHEEKRSLGGPSLGL